MQDIIAMLDDRQRQVHAFIDEAGKEREKLVNHLNTLDRDIASAEQDGERLARARRAIEDSPMHPEEAAIKACEELSQPSYRPGR